LAGWLGDGVVGWLVGWSQGAKESPFSTDGKVKKMNIYATLGGATHFQALLCGKHMSKFSQLKRKIAAGQKQALFGLGKMRSVLDI